jgi:cellulose synthase/poly-beta-1,6-N-acetylglucosamine synthase-like glycosyltransferase
MSAIHPRLSVIIPHLNEPENLNRCLRSLDAQRSDAMPFEVIVVDNGSRALPEIDGSLTIEVRLEREPVPGPGPARNRGASVARAEVLAFVDADCVAHPAWISTIVTFMDDNPQVDVIGGDIALLRKDPRRMTAVEGYESIYSYRNKTYVERHGYSATGNMAVRTRVFRSVGPFGGISTMEDTEWGKRATAQGHPIAYVAGAIVATPSCQSFEELAKRWDRHVAHEFRDLAPGPKGLLGWLAKSAVIAGSPVGEIFRIARSDRVSGPRERFLALVCTTRVRLYRARRMVGLALKDNASAMVDSWNRENP